MSNNKNKQEKIFADGFSFKRRDNAPDFVVGRMSVKIDDAIAFFKKHDSNGWVNLNVNQANSGNYYVELDQWKPENNKSANKNEAVNESVTDDVPF